MMVPLIKRIIVKAIVDRCYLGYFLFRQDFLRDCLVRLG